MNKKGFAYITIVYTIMLLIVSLLYMLLGIMRNRYSVNDDLRKSIISDLNSEEYLKKGDILDNCMEEVSVSIEEECQEEENVTCVFHDGIYEKHVYQNVCE